MELPLLCALVFVALLAIGTTTYLQTLHARQIAELCQRIQAPDTAVAQHVVQEQRTHSPAHLPFDDDDAWMTYARDVRDAFQEARNG